MERPSVHVLVLLLVVASAARAQEQDLPPGAKLKVLDIVFRVEDIGGRVADMQLKETDTELRIELAADVLFEFDKATLQPAAEETLAKAAGIIREKGTGVVRIEGHTDSKGDNAYNQRLSERRANSVRQWFIRHGLGGVKFSSRGFGETRPIASNAKPDGSDDPEGRRKNRRVEIVIAKTG
jgi:outer membrane protein OmpA-like peptidoglycan-associated protein